MRNSGAIVLMLLGAVAGLGLPVVDADAEYFCTATVGVPCNFFCDYGDYLTIDVYGASGASGTATCGGEVASCVVEGEIYHCYDASEASDGGWGTCEVTGGSAVCYSI